MIRISLALLLTCVPCGMGAFAQAARTPGGMDQFALDTSAPKPARRRKPATAPAPSPDSDRDARLAEARRKFFQKPEEPKSDTVKDFGGYDYRRDSGTMSPGATFKF